MLSLLAAVAISSIDSLQDRARRVTILRDEWGVPHIDAPTDADCVFGLVYAQLEDHFPQIESQVIGDVGRGAEAFGPARLESDLRFRLFEIEKRCRREYDASSAAMRAIADAYADAFNFYLATHRQVRPRLITHYDPWFMFATQAGPGGLPPEAGGRSVLDAVDEIGPKTDTTPIPPPAAEDTGLAFETGSNAWAIGPKRTTSGHAILFSNPHVGFFGAEVRYECHVRSREGWNFSGFATVGSPLPHAGHNDHLGWTHTNVTLDNVDVYAETLADQDHYRYGSEARAIESWTAPVLVKTDSGVKTRTFRFRKTHHGPIVGKSGDHPLALRWRCMERGGYWAEKYAMGKARDLTEFKRALSIRAIPASNTTYADDQGHVAFWCGNSMPRRAEGLDPSKPLDGKSPRTEWQGYHEIDELPHVIDPADGWLQNCNSDPEFTTGSGNPKRASFRRYMIGDPMTLRAENSRRILASRPKFSYEDLERLAFDDEVYSALKRVPMLVRSIEGLPFERKAPLGPALEVLRAWDRRANVDSVGATLYVLTEEEAWAQETGGRRRGLANSELFGGAFETVVGRLKSQFGDWRVKWGDVNRLQRPTNDPVRPQFSDDAPSLPCGGAPGQTGTIFAFYPSPDRTTYRRYGATGDSYVALVEFGAPLRAKSIYVFGQSGDPKSPHWFDQATLYATGRFKDSWFAWDDVLKRATRTYHPGE